MHTSEGRPERVIRRAPPIRRCLARLLLGAALLIVSASVQAAPALGATPAPGWLIRSLPSPTNYSAADNAGCMGSVTANLPSCDTFTVAAQDSGAAALDGSDVTLTDTVPAGLTVQRIALYASSSFQFQQFDLSGFSGCSSTPVAAGTSVQCTLPSVLFSIIPVNPGDWLTMDVYVTVDDPSAAGPLTNAASVSGGGAPTGASANSENTVGQSSPAFGLHAFSSYVAGADGQPNTQAGGHPTGLTTVIDLNDEFRIAATAAGVVDQSVEDPKDVVVDLPLGLLGSAVATPQCTIAQLASLTSGGGGCPADTQVGFINTVPFNNGDDTVASPIWNLVPERGVAAEFGYIDAIGGTHALYARVVPSPSGYLLQVTSPDAPQIPFTGIAVTFYGDPARHNNSGSTPAALFTNPSDCNGGPLTTKAYADSWQHPGALNPDGTPDLSDPNWLTTSSDSPPVTGCNQLTFKPTISVQPDSSSADSSSGLDVEIRVPQSEDPSTLATPPLKKGVVTLPQGVSVNPSAADGLGACSPAQIDLASAASPSCPDSSKIGTVSLQSPLLPGTLQGSIYLATQNDNPFGALLAGYIVVDDPATGVVIKIPGKLTPDPQTGQITGIFDNNPQFPFSDLRLHFFGGDRGELSTPQSCGTYTTTSELTPWSAPDSGPPAAPSDSFQISSGPGGGPCPDYLDPAKFTPGFSAGSTIPLAGSSTGFLLKVTRPDGQQYLKQIHLDLPPGLVAKLSGVPRCSQAQITPGVGGSTSCPAGSQIGTVNIGAGTGSSPFFLKNQPVYLTEGYGGAPYGIAIDTHAVAGPLDLGHVVVRSTLNVDQSTAQVHIDSETLPWILQGIPLHIRSIAVNVDRPGFMVNPTNCNPMQVTGTVTGGGQDFSNPADDTVKPVADHFQVGGCGGLGFSPHLSGQILNGPQGIHRSDHPNLAFDLHATPGDANLASVAVLLPQAFQIDQANLGNICSETELATNECAGRNTVGTASATTPLLDSTLSGPVYAVSGSGGLPKLAVILNGPAADPVHLLVRGITDTVGARIRNTFPLVPDTPITDFNLTLNGGPGGYLVNNTDVCGSAKGHSRKARNKAKKLRQTNLTADAAFTAQDADTLAQSVPISAQCPTKHERHRRSAKHRKRR